ncbi:hypothetical protein ABS642_01040 [Microbacterium sp. A8/3-1]|uniref:Uncharacterized protein n=1 Tax=Microbacterium sp. A8/3-1 TaxID=3160749 RepID=A0AAU7VYV2_9MICO
MTPVQAGRFFRAYVASRLVSLGVSGASARTDQARRPVRLSEAFAEAAERPASDVLGVPGWSLVTSHRMPLDVAKALDAARVAAALDGNQKFAAICSRPGANPEASYVVTTMEVLADLVRESDHDLAR